MKHRMRSALICCVITLSVLVSPVKSQAQEAQLSSYQAMSDKFFDMLQHDKTAEAIDFMFATNPALNKLQDQADQLKAQFASMRTVIGPYISHTRLIETKTAGMFVYQHYFVAYERQPISVRIKYYKPGATWMCYGVQFDGNLTDIIQKSADERISEK